MLPFLPAMPVSFEYHSISGSSGKAKLLLRPTGPIVSEVSRKQSSLPVLQRSNEEIIWNLSPDARGPDKRKLYDYRQPSLVFEVKA